MQKVLNNSEFFKLCFLYTGFIVSGYGACNNNLVGVLVLPYFFVNLVYLLISYEENE